MPRNIEVKARLGDLKTLAERLASLASTPPHLLPQDDTYFRCDSGRLKLRASPNGAGELIFYAREDRAGPKESSYLIVPVASPDALRDALTRAYGQIGRIRKQRILYVVGRTRIHLDTVESLGTFLEVEVVLADGEPAERGIAEAETLMRQLGVEPSQVVAKAYIDMLRESSV